MNGLVAFRPPTRETPRRPRGDAGPDARRSSRPAPETGRDGPGGGRLVCRNCGHAITRAEERRSVDGSHRHVFSNPHGYVFELGCFRSAPGCAPHGAFTTEFTWFQGYAWQISLCGGCGALLGWRYRNAGGDGFYGLILPELREIDD